jgi:hypothetical protein
MKKIYLYVTGCGIVSTLIVVIFFLEVLWQLFQLDEETRQFVGIHLGMDFSLLGAAVLLVAGVKAYRSVSAPVPQKDATSEPRVTGSIAVLPK